MSRKFAISGGTKFMYQTGLELVGLLGSDTGVQVLLLNIRPEGEGY